MQRLNSRQIDLLRWLEDPDGSERDGWRTPMDLGGADGSFHSRTLNQLVRRGLAERKKLHAIYCPNGTTYRRDAAGNVTDDNPPYPGCRCKGSCRYRRTPAGKEALRKAMHALAEATQ